MPGSVVRICAYHRAMGACLWNGRQEPEKMPEENVLEDIIW